MKSTKEYPNANTVPANAFIVLASIETSNMPLKHVLHASTIATGTSTAAQANPGP